RVGAPNALPHPWPLPARASTAHATRTRTRQLARDGAQPRGPRPLPIPKDWFNVKKQVLVSVDRAETRVALLEASGTPAASRSIAKQQKGGPDPGAGYRIAELYIERRGGRSIVGNIYKGKVDNVLPGLEAAFVDIGL